MKSGPSFFLVILIAATICFARCTPELLACCSVPDTGSVGQSVSFSSSCSMGAYSYAWDFGDGSGSGDPNPVHTYTKGGTYMVKLTVTGKNGKNRDSTTDVIQIN